MTAAHTPPDMTAAVVSALTRARQAVQTNGTSDFSPSDLGMLLRHITWVEAELAGAREAARTMTAVAEREMVRHEATRGREKRVNDLLYEAAEQREAAIQREAVARRALDAAHLMVEALERALFDAEDRLVRLKYGVPHHAADAITEVIEIVKVGPSQEERAEWARAYPTPPPPIPDPFAAFRGASLMASAS